MKVRMTKSACGPGKNFLVGEVWELPEELVDELLSDDACEVLVEGAKHGRLRTYSPAVETATQEPDEANSEDEGSSEEVVKSKTKGKGKKK